MREELERVVINKGIKISKFEIPWRAGIINIGSLLFE